jgi:hypothetical protein
LVAFKYTKDESFERDNIEQRYAKVVRKVLNISRMINN